MIIPCRHGHIYPQADSPPDSGSTFRQTNQILEQAHGEFRDVSPQAGPGF